MKNPQKLPKSQYKPEEWKEPKSGTRWDKEKRREYIKKIAVDIGLYNVNKSELAQKMGVDRKTLYNDIIVIIKSGLDKNELMYSKIKINNALLKVMKEMHAILIKGKTDADKAKAAKVLIDATEAHTNFLERFGIKDIQAPVTESQVIVKFGTEPKKKK